MPIATDGKQPNEIVRTVAVIRGVVDFTMRCQPRFNYGMCAHTTTLEDRFAIFSAASACPPLALYSTVDLREQTAGEDTLVFRYEAERTHVDGLPGAEGSFTACSFWYIECLARAGELEKAELLFEKLLGFANHLGLYSEQIGPSGQHLGNFPQAFTHLALISAASYLDRVLSGSEETVWR